MLPGPCLPCDFDPLISSISTSELMDPAIAITMREKEVEVHLGWLKKLDIWKLGNYMYL